MSKYFNRGHYGLQSATERLEQEFSQADLKKKASLWLDFANREYWTRSLSDDGTPQAFGDILTFTRDSDKTGFVPVGLATVGADVPALPLDPLTKERLGISIHGQRTNSVTNSQLQTNSTLSTGTRTINAGTDPSGGNGATQLSVGSDELFSIRNTGPSCVLNQLDSHSLFYKVLNLTPDSNGDAFLYFADGGRNLNFKINLQTNTGMARTLEATSIFDNDSPIEVKGLPGGWYYAKSPVRHGGSGERRLTIQAGEGTIVQVWGVQAELNAAFPTPPIITSGTAVTRLADNCRILDIDQSDWWDPNEGTFVVEFELGAFVQFQRLFGAAETGSSPNSISLFQATSQRLALSYFDPAGNAVEIVSVGQLQTKNKAAISWRAGGELRLSLNGEDTRLLALSSVAPITPTTLGIGRRGISSTLAAESASFKSLTYTPRAMTAAELQQASKLGA